MNPARERQLTWLVVLASALLTASLLACGVYRLAVGVTQWASGDVVASRRD